MDIAPRWLVLDRKVGDLEGQIYRSIRDRVLGGALPAGRRLPSTRALALSLEVSRATVVGAYERLKAEGYLESTAGSATRIGQVAVPLVGRSAPRITRDTAEPKRFATPARFMPGVPDLSSFPHKAWSRCLAARARSFRHYDLGYSEGQGLPELRRSILDHITTTRGVSAVPEQMFIVPSTQVALDLLSRVLLLPKSPGRPTVWIEEPGYDVARATFRAAGARLVPVPCDGDGIDTRTVTEPRPELVYTTPSHQYPTGATMSLQRRLDLLEIARASNAVVIEDDYDSEYHFGDRPIAALQGIDRADVVAYLGTFSKTLAPGLRVAYMVLPRRLVKKFSIAYQLYGGAVVSLHIQAALADFISEGHLRTHLRQMKPIYAARMRAVTEALHRYCESILDIGPGNDGLQLATWFKNVSTDDVAIVENLSQHGYAMHPMSNFYLKTARPGLLFGVAGAHVENVNEDIQRLALSHVVVQTRAAAPRLRER